MAIRLVGGFAEICFGKAHQLTNQGFTVASRNLRMKYSTKYFPSIPKKGLFPKTSYSGLTSLEKTFAVLQPTRNISVVSKIHEATVLQLKVMKSVRNFQVRHLPTLNQVRRQKPRTKKKRPKAQLPKDKQILLGPQRKGVCVKLVVRTPKKPNSAQRKCAILRLSNGKLITAYIPGEKGTLQEHGVVLFEGGRVQDCPGIKYKIIRRKYDMN